jgi:hypothetical protein
MQESCQDKDEEGGAVVDEYLPSTEPAAARAAPRCLSVRRRKTTSVRAMLYSEGCTTPGELKQPQSVCVTITSHTEQILANVDSWEFNIFELEEATQARCHLLRMCHNKCLSGHKTGFGISEMLFGMAIMVPEYTYHMCGRRGMHSLPLVSISYTGPVCWKT